MIVIRALFLDITAPKAMITQLGELSAYAAPSHYSAIIPPMPGQSRLSPRKTQTDEMAIKIG
jgi:hypothetical protein